VGQNALAATVRRLQEDGITVCLAAAQDIEDALRQFGIAQRVARDRIFKTRVETYRRARI
jgi:hypothetical protein